MRLARVLRGAREKLTNAFQRNRFIMRPLLRPSLLLSLPLVLAVSVVPLSGVAAPSKRRSPAGRRPSTARCWFPPKLPDESAGGDKAATGEGASRKGAASGARLAVCAGGRRSS